MPKVSGEVKLKLRVKARFIGGRVIECSLGVIANKLVGGGSFKVPMLGTVEIQAQDGSELEVKEIVE